MRFSIVPMATVIAIALVGCSSDESTSSDQTRKSATTRDRSNGAPISNNPSSTFRQEFMNAIDHKDVCALVEAKADMDGPDRISANLRLLSEELNHPVDWIPAGLRKDVIEMASLSESLADALDAGDEKLVSSITASADFTSARASLKRWEKTNC